MSRRWIIGTVLGVVALAGFLVWAFLSPPAEPLTIRFQGYMTNSALRINEALPPKDGSVLVVFAATNHSAHIMSMYADATFPVLNGVDNTPGLWLDVANCDPYLGTNWPLLKPGEGVRVGARVLTTDKPITMYVAGYSFVRRDTRWDRIRLQLPWNRRVISTKAMSEPR